jgi:hypothetical protein
MQVFSPSFITQSHYVLYMNTHCFNVYLIYVISTYYIRSIIIIIKKLRCLSRQANYTDRATAACRTNECQFLLIEGVAWSAQQNPMVIFSVF